MSDRAGDEERPWEAVLDMLKSELEEETYPPGSEGEFDYIKRVTKEIRGEARPEAVEDPDAHAEWREGKGLNAIPDASILMDLNGKIVRINRHALLLFDVSVPEEMFETEITEWIAQEDHGRALYDTVKACRGGGVRGTAYTFLRRDGSTFTGEVSMASVGGRSKRRFLVATVRDTSDLKRLLEGILRAGEGAQRGVAMEFREVLLLTLDRIAALSDLLSKDVELKSTDHMIERIRDLSSTVEKAAEQTHLIAGMLCAAELEEEGLSSALRELCDHVEKRREIPCTLSCDDPFVPLEPAVGTHLYRIAQESITNAVNHGRAARIAVELSVNRDTLTLSVRDDGEGIPDVLDEHEGMGLDIMRLRASLINASLHVGRGRDGGTDVVCSLPLGKGDETRPDTC